MCLLAFAYRVNPAFPLIIAGNRDEFFDRPTASLDHWVSARGTAILGGRDLKNGGSWMGFTSEGRFAMLTSVREEITTNSLVSRGELVCSWLDSQLDFPAWRQEIDISCYNGFNLIAGDWKSHGFTYFTNRPTGWEYKTQSRVYGLSNAALNTPWVKTVKLKHAVQNACKLTSVAEISGTLLAALKTKSTPPSTLKQAQRNCFVRYPEVRPVYGTRSSWVAVLGQGKLYITEHSYNQFDLDSSVSVKTLDWPKL